LFCPSAVLSTISELPDIFALLSFVENCKFL
jgi:hypothetical protein